MSKRRKPTGTRPASRAHAHAAARAKEIERVACIHRDPFEPILPVLEADSPVAEYRKIADEILRHALDSDRYPRRAAENGPDHFCSFDWVSISDCARRICGSSCSALVTACQDRNGSSKTSSAKKSAGMSGSTAGRSSSRPLHSKMPIHPFSEGSRFVWSFPTLEGLYGHIEEYIRRHRAVLLNEAQDPGTFFIKTVKRTSSDAEYTQKQLLRGVASRHPTLWDLQSLYGAGRHQGIAASWSP